MGYTPRLTDAGIRNSKYYDCSSSGYNHAIPINGTHVLPNCFAADTQVVTDKGIKSIVDCVGQRLRVPTIDNCWRFAEFKHFGVQPLMRVVIGRRQFLCTAEHYWPTLDQRYQFQKFVRTDELLLGMRIPLAFTQEVTYPEDCEAVRHGFIFGDGCQGYKGRYTSETVQCVEPTDLIQDVYCAVEPVTHTFTLEGGILTSNCVGYAYGRFMEAAGITSCKLPTSNGGQWWFDVGSNYPKGQTPKLGAVACYRDNTGQAGHVAIVEQINSDGSIVTSNSAYGRYDLYFYLSTVTPPYYTWSSKYSLQGFIYNTHLGADSSSSNAAEQFIAAAKNHINHTRNDIKKIISATPLKWAAAFICACAKEAGGILGTVIAEEYNQEDMFKVGIKNSWGKFIAGPQSGVAAKPTAGDLIAFKYSKRSSGPYDGDHVGIVVSVVNNNVTYISGDGGNTMSYQSKVSSQKCAINSNTILGYYRPMWSRIHSDIADVADNGLYTTGQLYTTQNTSEDAVIREVGYLDSRYKPSISSSGIRLSVVNYTDLLAAFVSHLGVTPSQIDEGTSNADVITDGVVEAAARTVIEYLVQKGLNGAAAVGVAANIKRESGFNTAIVGDYGTSFGICQWHNARGDAMKRTAGANWRTNLSGQLDYLWYELTTAYKSVYTALKGVDNTLAGAKAATDIFVRKFEVPANLNDESALRQKFAEEYWNQIVIQKV